MESKHYYIDLINSTKANQFTSYYHYSKQGFKKAKINLGIYRKSDNLLVGCLQWGVSAQENIKLKRYVLEDINKEDYLELNRFCMADSEGKNAESEAISLGIKWIKANTPVKLLVSYAGRKEGNYGYIYQATNWEYLGYFISNGFWFLDGKERHQITAWYYYKKYVKDENLGFTEGLCTLYSQVIQTWTKQFIYIQRLDKSLTCASPVLPYPKPANEYPICVKTKVNKDEPFIPEAAVETNAPVYYYEKEKWLFLTSNRDKCKSTPRDKVACYDIRLQLEKVYDSIAEAARDTGISISSVNSSISKNKRVKGCVFRKYKKDDEPLAEITIDYICEIDGIKFDKASDVARYCGVTRQAVSLAKQKRSSRIGEYEVFWV